MKTGMTQLWVQVILYLILILSGTWMLLCPISGMDFQAVEGGGIRYEPAVVTEVLEEELTPSTLGSQLLGRQTLEIRLEDGSTVTLENYLTDTHNVLAEAGQKVVVCVDAPEGAEPYYTLYNYDRSGAVAVIVLIFLGLMVLVGRRKGFDAALALLFSLRFLFRIALPSIYAGSSPIGAGMIAVLISTTVTMLLLYGVHIRSVLAIGVTLAGECAACLFFLLFSQMLHISGFQTSDAESLLVAAQQTGLEIEQLLFAATMIASLGAVMDVAVSLLSALWEIRQNETALSGRQLLRSGLNIGRDMIGTMSNTLIFAFVGGALGAVLVLFSYGVQAEQLLSSDYVAVELAQGVCGTAAVILTVPVASAAAAVLFPHHQKIPGHPSLHKTKTIKRKK